MTFDLILKQVTISQLANMTPSSLNRFLSDKKYPELDTSSKSRKYYSYETSRAILRDLITSKRIPSNKIQVFFNFKGGTGKTSICYQVSCHMALMGYKVLVVDLDPQAHLSYACGINEGQDFPTLYDVVVNNFSINDTIKNIKEGLDIIPANLSLTRLELPLNQLPNREKVFTKILNPLKDKYDFIFIDTNPTISTVNRNATLAADVLNIVCETQPYSLKGLEVLKEEIESFSEAMDLKIKYKIIPNKYESKTVTSQEALGSLRYDYGEFVLDSVIRKSEDINISAKKQEPVVCFCNKNSSAFEDINDLVWEIIKNNTIELEH